MSPALFSPFQLRDLQLNNRFMVSPMGQYAADDGFANDWHLVHLGKYAVGGAGIVFVESTSVERRGGSTPHDLGLWDDAQIDGLKRIVRFVQAQGSAIGIQLGHAGRKANQSLPWEETGPCINPEKNGYPIAPSPIAYSPSSSMPFEMTASDIHSVVDSFAAAAKRARWAGFDIVEIHGAHGYLIHQFLSSQTNRRNDKYGGSPMNRFRFALEVTEAVRAALPASLPLFFRMSVADPTDSEWSLDYAVALATALKAAGVDLIDCSSGGIGRRATTMPGFRPEGYQVPLAQLIKQKAGVATAAVGMITSATFADDVIRRGAADIVAIGREALVDPHWLLHAAQELISDEGFRRWPYRHGWWLEKRAEGQRTKA